MKKKKKKTQKSKRQASQNAYSYKQTIRLREVTSKYNKGFMKGLCI
jgi:hypothetical protein